MSKGQQAIQARLAGATWNQIAADYGYANARSARSSVLYAADPADRPALRDAAPRPGKGTCNIPGCSSPHFARGWCKTHYARWRRHGTTDDRPRDSLPIADRFWPNVNRGDPDDCWEWQAARNHKGYGTVNYHGHYLAHRLAWTLTNGPIPAGLFACHHCDNPPCCNPSHLFLGTGLDNAADMVSKGRQSSLPGSTNGYARLDEDKVRAIRQAYAEQTISQQALANLYGVGQSAISAAIARKTWKHIT